MKKLFKKAVCLLLVLIMLVGIMPQLDLQQLKAQAASTYAFVKEPATVSNATGTYGRYDVPWEVNFTPVRMEDGRICSSQLQTGSNSFDIPKQIYDKETNSCGDNNFWPLGRLPKPTFMHRYGYYEVRCKLQKTDGWWSAFWIQSPSIGTTYDPEFSGVEVDIMEYFGNMRLTSGNFYGGYGADLKKDARVHYDLNGKAYSNYGSAKITDEDYPALKKAEDEFHRFGLLWTENEYVFYYDGKETGRTQKPISQIPQFILLTTEVKGYRNGNGLKHSEKAEKCLGDSFVVDYVRVFDKVTKE